MENEQAWQGQSREAMERFIEALQEELGSEATIADIEGAMVRHYQALLSDVMQALVKNQRSFPPGAE